RWIARQAAPRRGIVVAEQRGLVAEDRRSAARSAHEKRESGGMKSHSHPKSLTDCVEHGAAVPFSLSSPLKNVR
ncbi:MAG: hypothetical protein ABIP39_10240, partial [Polyangiaceae bacterium]